MIELVIFYVFAAVLLFAATMVITARNPVHSALFLVLAFFNSAACTGFREVITRSAAKIRIAEKK